jgi:uncharacterized membrane protein
MTFLFPLHPRFVHFPIALSLTGVALIILGLLLKREWWIEHGRFSLVLGWLGVLVASLTGLIDEARAPDSPAVQTVLNQHITVGVSLLVVFGFALYLPLRNRGLWNQASEPAPRQTSAFQQSHAIRPPRSLRTRRASRNQRALFMALLVIGAGLILLEGWLGGKLVYSLGVGVAAH